MSCSVSKLPKGKCGAPPKIANPKSLKDLVDAYLDARPDRYCAKALSIPEAVFGWISDNPQLLPDVLLENQWDAFIDKVTIDRHQSRKYSKRDLRDIAEYLANNWKRNTFSDFEDLYEYVCSILVLSLSNSTEVVKNPHALILFDIAIRLAERFNVWPKKYVYLNGNGPFEAAMDLGLGNFIKGRKISYGEIIKYYPEFLKLDAAQLEDYLCIYHEQLKQFKNPQL